MVIATNIPGLVVLSVILVVLVVIVESGLATRMSAPETVETVVNHPFFQDAMSAYTEVIRRGIPGVIIFTVIMMQVLLASEVLSEEKAKVLTSLFYVGPLEFGIYPLISVLLLVWVFEPFARFGIRSAGAAIGLREFPGREDESGA
jgi:hypothetical protein